MYLMFFNTIRLVSSFLLTAFDYSQTAFKEFSSSYLLYNPLKWENLASSCPWEAPWSVQWRDAASASSNSQSTVLPTAFQCSQLEQRMADDPENTLFLDFVIRKIKSVIVRIRTCNPYSFRHFLRMPTISNLETNLHSLPSHHHTILALSPVMDLLSHPTLGVRRTRGSSSEVRAARQGTEFSSGLRALVSEAEDRRRKRTHEQPQERWGWKH